MPYGCVIIYIIALLCRNDARGVMLCTTYRRGASALLVLIAMGNAKASKSGTSDR